MLGKFKFLILFIAVNLTLFIKCLLRLRDIPIIIGNNPEVFVGLNLISSFGTITYVVASRLLLNVVYMPLI